MQPEQLSGFPLSSQQRCLWVQQQRSSTLRENSECRVHITGPIDRSRLERAIESVVARHEILRTSFVSIPGMSFPLQVIDALGHAQLEYSMASTLAQENGSGAESGLSGLRACLTPTSPNEHSLRLIAPAHVWMRRVIGFCSTRL